MVRKGDILLTMGDREAYQSAVTAAALELETARQMRDDLLETADLHKSEAWMAMVDAKAALIDAQVQWDEFEDGTYAEDLETAEQDLIEAQAALDEAQADFDPYADFDENNLERRRLEDSLEQAQLEYDDMLRERDLQLVTGWREEARLAGAQALYDDAQRRYEKLSGGPDPDLLAQADARLENAQAHLSAAQAAFNHLELTAPMDGRVVDIHVSEGEQVMPGQNGFLLADFSSWYVETRDLTEMEVVDVSEGQVVTVVPDAFPDMVLTGTLQSIADLFEERLGDITYTVRIRLDDTDVRLRWGMTVQVTFDENH